MAQLDLIVTHRPCAVCAVEALRCCPVPRRRPSCECAPLAWAQLAPTCSGLRIRSRLQRRTVTRARAHRLADRRAGEPRATRPRTAAASTACTAAAPLQALARRVGRPPRRGARARRIRRPAAPAAKRSGRRSASQRSSRRSAAAASSSSLRWTLPCSRATTSPARGSRRGTRRRSPARRPASRCALRAPMWRGQCVGGVVPLPRSCTRQAKRTGSGAAGARPCRAPASGARRCRPRGGASAGCGTPHRRSTSGSRRASAPQSRSTSNMRLGRGSIRPRASSCHDALGHQRVDLAGVDHRAHQRQRLGRDREARPARREARQPQDAHRVFGEGVATRGAARRPAGRPRRRTDRSARRRRSCGHRVDRQVAARQVLFQRDVGSAWNDEAAVAGRRLALGARERVFLVRLRMQEDREVAPDRRVARPPPSARAWRRRRPSRGR